MLRLPLTTLTLGVALAAGPVATALAADADTTLLLDRPFGAVFPTDGVGASSAPVGTALSDDGRYVAFVSTGDDLAAGDDDTITNVYRRDRQTGQTTLVTVGAHKSASDPAISGDGSVVAFVTPEALAPGDTNDDPDVYVRDLAAGTTELAARADGANGAPGALGSYSPALDDDGSMVAFVSGSALEGTDVSAAADVYRRNLQTDTTDHVSRASGGNGTSSGGAWATSPAISADGSVVAFTTSAAYDAAHDTNGEPDVYLREGTATELVARAGSAGDTPASGSREPSISDDGDRVAFETRTEMLAGDPNGTYDVYVRDRALSALLLGSRRNGPGNVTGDGAAINAALSPDGGHVAFVSRATNHAPGDTDPDEDVVVRAIAAGTTTLVSRGPGPDGASAEAIASAPNVSSGGAVALFTTYGHGISELAEGDAQGVFARVDGTNELISRPTGPADAPFRGGVGDAYLTPYGLSADGRFAVFSSTADHLSDADDDRYENVFLRDLVTGEMRLLSRPPGGGAADGDSTSATISADGRRVAFTTYAPNISGVVLPKGSRLMVVDVATGAMQVADVGTDGAPSASGVDNYGVLDADGSRIAFVAFDKLHPDDPSELASVYLRDLAAGTTELVSRTAAGAGDASTSDQPSISADGTRVAFASQGQLHPGTAADGDPDVYVRDLAAGTTLLASAADGSDQAPPKGHDAPSISADGRRVAFRSRSAGLGDGDTDTTADIHLRDLATGRTTLVSVDGAGVKNDGPADEPVLSADGTKVALEARGLLTGGTVDQVVLRDLAAGTTRVVSRGPGADGALANGQVEGPSISGNGSCVGFGTAATNLVPGGYDSAEHWHAYVRAVDGGCAVGAANPTPPVAQPDPPASPTTPAPPAVAKDRIAPKVSGLKVVRGRGRKPKTTLRFTLSEAARVTVTLARKTAGRRRGKACVKPSLVKKRGAKRCTRLVVARTIKVGGRAGANTVTLPKGLARGGYVVGVSARDAAGNGSNPRTVALRVGS